ncbi:Uncharacterised protein [Neisseria lactamica]|uniref:hypothetical protein n=1 Tax=Neisseria lactamica TaxID=486 RepID=UPI000504C2DE|nr:hypothetical protein [Neisseria lactamica]KFJ36122.1 methylated-DNA---cysteine methyltransferase domain protein [Neisseria lactamica ATCC 23970]VTQ48030.1 Uncharacterised protein [Neisseria lactamica]
MKKALKWISTIIIFTILTFSIFIYGYQRGKEDGIKYAEIKNEKDDKQTLCLQSIWEFNDECNEKESDSIHYIDIPESNPKDIKQ